MQIVPSSSVSGKRPPVWGVCSLCQQEDNDPKKRRLIDIHGAKGTRDQFYHKIRVLLNLDLGDKEPLATMMCGRCESKIVAFWKFREKIHQIQEKTPEKGSTS